MILMAFAIFDVKSDSFSVPFFKPAIGLALRDFSDLVNDRNSTPGRHPEDFKLVKIGEFDDLTGVLLRTDVIQSLGFGSDFIERAPGVSTVPSLKVS